MHRMKRSSSSVYAFPLFAPYDSFSSCSHVWQDTGQIPGQGMSTRRPVAAPHDGCICCGRGLQGLGHSHSQKRRGTLLMLHCASMLEAWIARHHASKPM